MRDSFIENIYHLDDDLHLNLTDRIPLESFYIVPKETNLSKILFLTGHRFSATDILQPDALMLFKRMVASIALDDADYHLLSISNTTDFKDRNLSILKQEIFKYRPTVIICFGADAASVFLGKKEMLSKIHGIIYDKKLELNQEMLPIKMMPTFHPEVLLVNTPMRETTWKDLQNLMAQKIW